MHTPTASLIILEIALRDTGDQLNFYHNIPCEITDHIISYYPSASVY